MKLYASPTSPFARKVRALALEKKLELVSQDVAPPYAEVASLNPLGKIPVLELDDGTVLFDSAVILDYLDGLAPPSLHGEGSSRIAIGVWHALGDGIMEATVARMLEMRRPPEKQAPERIQQQEQKIARALDYAEARVGPGHLVDDAFSVADIALCSAIGYLDLRHPHDWRAAHPRLAAYLERVGARPCLAGTRPAG